MSIEFTIALFGFASSVFVAVLGGMKDRNASTELRQRVIAISKENTAWRHYANTLIAWGAHAVDPPPRDPPDPPNILMGG